MFARIAGVPGQCGRMWSGSARCRSAWTGSTARCVKPISSSPSAPRAPSTRPPALSPGRAPMACAPARSTSRRPTTRTCSMGSALARAGGRFRPGSRGSSEAQQNRTNLPAHLAGSTVGSARVGAFLRVTSCLTWPGSSEIARKKISREDNMRHQIILLAGMGFAVAAPAIAVAQSALPEIKSEATAQAVLDEHMDALNHCDWNRIVAQYPDDAQINLPGGAVVAGRKAIGEMFAGFCKDSKDGGLKGINFKVEHSTTIGDTFATQWVATADFLAEPYRGSDAYITKNRLMQAMVTTFDGGALKMKK